MQQVKRGFDHMRTVLIFVGIIALVAIAVGAYLVFGVRSSDGPTSLPAEISGSVDVDSAPVATPDAISTRNPPTFDIVRVDTTGEAVMAGRADPGDTIQVLANGVVIGETVADMRGDWTLIVATPMDEGDQEITLVSTNADGDSVASEQAVVVGVPERADEAPLVVLSSPNEASRILQGPRDGVRQGTLVLSSVDYDETGNVIFAGEAEPGATVRVYVADQPVGSARADNDSRWTLQPRYSIPPGLYTLRVDLISDEDGSVLERVEVPFERALQSDIVMSSGRVIVQPGNSLWLIAREVYGEGVSYTAIYRANDDQIRDPDLIYPGQIFEVPNAN